MADRNQDGLTGYRKTQGKWVAEIGWRLPRVAGDIWLRMPRPIEGCGYDNGDGDGDDDDDDDDECGANVGSSMR